MKRLAIWVLVAGCGADGALLEQGIERPDQHDAGHIDAPDDAGIETIVDASEDADAGAEHDDSGIVHDDSDASEPCDTSTFYRDADADGFGDAMAIVTACERPIGYVTNSDDCFDGNKLARPGQTSGTYRDRGDGSFDYDCDGNESPVKSRLAMCPDIAEAANCPPPSSWPPGVAVCDYESVTEGWSQATTGWLNEVPPCGALALWGILVHWNATDGHSCSDSMAKQYQTCL